MVAHHPQIVSDIEKIELLAQLRKEENRRFHTFLKGHNARKIDLVVHQLNDEIAPQIDCTACGNCCKHLCPCITKNDLRHLSEALLLSPPEVIEKYIETKEGEMSYQSLPCAFIKENKCTIYKHRPEACASFPHLHKEGFISRARKHIGNYAVCPIVYNVIERMKCELKFEIKSERS